MTLVIASAGAPTLEPAHFAPAPGWQLLRGKVGACPGVPASRCSTVTSTASIVKQVGNYAESFERNIKPLGIERGMNRLWSAGGILYAPDLR